MAWPVVSFDWLSSCSAETEVSFGPASAMVKDISRGAVVRWFVAALRRRDDGGVGICWFKGSWREAGAGRARPTQMP
jgi:hypothetical protein